MKLIMITPRVGTQVSLISFIPTWVRCLASKVDFLWVITPRSEPIELPDNVHVFEVGRDYTQHETLFHAVRNFNTVLNKLTSKHNVDGVFTHMYPKFALMAAPYTKKHHIPLVTWYAHNHISLQIRLVSKLADRIVTPSVESFVLPTPKKVVVGHGIDTSLFCPRPDTHEDIITTEQASDTRLNIITIGRISPVKDSRALIEAARILKQNGFQDFTMTFVGDAPPQHQAYYLELQSLIAQYEIENHVIFAGAVSNDRILPYLWDNDVFVNMQAEGGAGKAVLEAMSAGIPTVLCTPTFNSYLGNLVEELIFKKGDPVDLADKLLKLAHRGKTERQEIGLKLRQIVIEHHNLDKLMDRIVNLFETLKA